MSERPSVTERIRAAEEAAAKRAPAPTDRVTLNIYPAQQHQPKRSAWSTVVLFTVLVLTVGGCLGLAANIGDEPERTQREQRREQLGVLTSGDCEAIDDLFRSERVSGIRQAQTRDANGC